MGGVLLCIRGNVKQFSLKDRFGDRGFFLFNLTFGENKLENYCENCIFSLFKMRFRKISFKNPFVINFITFIVLFHYYLDKILFFLLNLAVFLPNN